MASTSPAILGEFNNMDQNRDGFVTVPELTAYAKAKAEATVTEFMRIADYDKDGRISLAEFETYLKSLTPK